MVPQSTVWLYLLSLLETNREWIALPHGRPGELQQLLKNVLFPICYLRFTVRDLLFPSWKSVRSFLLLASLRKCCRLASQRCAGLRASVEFLPFGSHPI